MSAPAAKESATASASGPFATAAAASAAEEHQASPARDSSATPPSAGTPSPSTPPPAARADQERHEDNLGDAVARLESVIPEVFRRVVEGAVGRLTDGRLRQQLGKLELTKEALHVITGQLDETKQGLYRVVAKEVRDFLVNTNLSEELTNALTKLSFEIRTEVRFVPNDASRPQAGSRPSVRSQARVKVAEENTEPLHAASADEESQ